MKVEFHDGMELELPDSLTDAQVQAIVDALVKAHTAAANAMSRADEAHAVASRPINIPASKGNEDVVAALTQLQATIDRGFTRMIAAQMADTVLVNDGLREEPNRARKVI